MSHIVKARLVCPDLQLLESCLVLPRNTHTHTHRPKHTMSYQIDSAHRLHTEIWDIDTRMCNLVCPISNTYYTIVYHFHTCRAWTCTHCYHLKVALSNFLKDNSSCFAVLQRCVFVLCSDSECRNKPQLCAAAWRSKRKRERETEKKRERVRGVEGVCGVF